MTIRTSADVKPDLFSEKSELETPTLLVDIEQLRENILEFRDIANENDVYIRSHSKVHKIPDLAHLQGELTGDRGVLCQTTSEAEVMAKSGIRNIRISNQFVDKRKLLRLVRISDRIDKLVTAVDGPGNIRPLQQVAKEHGVTINVDLEMDIGLERTGVKPGKPALQVAKLIDNANNLELQGLLAHDAHLPGQADMDAELEQLCSAAMDDIQSTVELLETSNITVNDVVSGCTLTAKHVAKHPVVTEIDPGRYLFNDGTTLGTIDRDRCALTVRTMVVSKPAENRAIVDAGYKTLGGRDQIPIPKQKEGIEFCEASAEHGHLDTSNYDGTVKVGDTVEFIPRNSHAAVGANHLLIGLKNNHVHEVWDILGRGKTK